MGTKQAVVRQVQGITFTAKSDSNHWITMDGPKALGGSEAGPRPRELVLMALGGCTGSNLVSILNKKKTPYRDLEIKLTASVREEHPQIFTDIHIEYDISGDGIDPADVERAIELATTKYCPVSAMLQGNVNITHAYTIHASESASAHCEAQRHEL